jgi:O-antigen/teichoic acid export membrane protein
MFGDASWALIGQVGSGLLLLAGTRAITELVSPGIYGEIALLIGIVALGINIFAYPFISAGMRLLPECLQRNEVPYLYCAVNRLTRRAITIALILLASGGAAYCWSGGADPWLFAVAGLLLIVTARRELGVQLLIGERRQREASLWQTSDAILRPVLAIAAVALGGAKAVLVLLGYTLASGIANAFWSLYQRLKANQRLRLKPAVIRSLKREIWTYTLPLIPMQILVWFNGLGDRYVIGYFMSAAEVGLYAAAYTLTNEAFNRSAMVLLRTFQPIYFQHHSAKQEEQAHKVFWLWLGCVTAMGITGVLALALLKDWVAALLLAKTYHTAAVLMPVIGAGCAIQALSTVIAQPLLAVKRTGALLMGRTLGAVTAVISLPLMVKEYGLIGAAMASPIYFGAEALSMAMLSKPWRMAKAPRRNDSCMAPESSI